MGPCEFRGSEPFGKITLPSQKELCMSIFIYLGDHNDLPPHLRGGCYIVSG